MTLNEKQIEILKVAENLFSKKGIEGTSIRDISKEAKINVAMVSYYFGSKNAMVTALFEIRLTRTREKLAALTDDLQLNPMDRLLGFVEHLITVQLQNAAFHIVLMNHLSKKDQDTEICEAIRKLQMEIMGVLGGFIDEGHASGLFQAKPDPITFLIFSQGVISYVIHHERTLSYYWEIGNHEEYCLHVKQHIYPYLLQSFKSILIYNEQK